MRKPRRIAQLEFDQYLTIEAANASSLKRIRKSTAHMLMPRVGSTSFDLGHSAHSLILEGLEAFRSRTAIRPSHFNSYRSNDAKQWRAEQLEAGLTVLTHDEAEQVKQVASNVSQHSFAVKLLEASKPRDERREVTMLWHDEQHDVPCKCRFDALAYLSDLEVIGVDLKTTQSAHRDDFARSAVKYGYDLQAAHYWQGFRAVHGFELMAYVIIAVETAPPYGVATYVLEQDWLDRGNAQRSEALEKYAEWHHAGRPDSVRAYPEHVQTLPMPRWA